jgi:uncharacterized phage infection (PIP) family protein YhgE
MTKSLVKADKTLDASIVALRELPSGGGDLKNRYDRYRSSVDDLADAAKDIRGEAESIKAEGESYFKWWEQQVAKVKNEDLKAASDERRQTIRAQFNALSGSFQTVKTQFGPYMSTLRDIEVALGAGLTPAMVNSARPVIAKAASQGADLRQSLNVLMNDYRAVGLELTSKTTSAAPAMKPIPAPEPPPAPAQAPGESPDTTPAQAPTPAPTPTNPK